MLWHYGPLAFAALSWSVLFLWIRRERQRQRRRRGGYVKPPASSTTNPQTAGPAAISFSSSPRLGLASAVEVGPATPPVTSSTGGLTFSGLALAGDPGRPPDSADSDDSAA